MKIFKRMLVIIIVIAVINLSVPKKVQAISWGGKLVKPLGDFALYVGDSIEEVVHNTLLGQDIAILRLDLSESAGDTILMILGAVAAAVVAVALVVVTAGAAAAAFAAIRSDFISGICWYSCFCCYCWRNYRSLCCI